MSEEAHDGPVDVERVAACLAEAGRAFEAHLHRSTAAGAADARGYLASRGFGSSTCRKWGIGYAPGHGRLTAYLMDLGFTPEELVAADLSVRRRDGGLTDRFYNRVTFPIRDENGRTLAFSARQIGSSSPAMGGKYVNSRETATFSKRDVLYGLDHAIKEIESDGQAILCEGYTDVVAMHEAGFGGAVATMGTALTPSHVRRLEALSVRRVTCMFDGDEAGQRAAERAMGLMRGSGMDIACVTLPGGRDPMEFLSDRGADEMRELLLAARPLPEFVLERRLAQYDLSVPGQIAAAGKAAEDVVSPLAGSWRAGPLVNRMSEALMCDRSTVLDLVGRSEGDEGATAEADLICGLALLRPITQEQAERVMALPWSSQDRRTLAMRVVTAGESPLEQADIVAMAQLAPDPTRPSPATADEAIDRAEIAMLQAALERQARDLPACRDAEGLAEASARLDATRARLEEVMGERDQTAR